MEHLDNQADGHKQDEPDRFQQLLERCYRTMQQTQEAATAAQYDMQTGMAGDE